ncbi:MAG: DUF1003 domain-containing protein [Candidatus Pacearchaeota archaeon]|nr:DUF1003 domain-containing protein [Candidatus Pacearchaeota archaeon]
MLPATFGQKAADKLTKWVGSWGFIILFLIILGIWVLAIFYTANELLEIDQFLLLNLVLSCIAAIQAPIILMSQNRANQKDRLRAEYDYSINKKSEKEIEQIKKQLDKIERKLK